MMNSMQLIRMARYQIAKRLEEAKTSNWTAARRAVKGQKNADVKARLLWIGAKEGRELQRLFTPSQLAKGYIVSGAVVHRIAFNGYSIWTENMMTGQQNRLAEITR